MDRTDAGASCCATVLDVLRPFASARSDVAALDAFDRSPLTYRPLLAVVFDIVRALRERGLEKRDTVAIVLPDGPDLATAFLAVSATAIAAPLNSRSQWPRVPVSIGSILQGGRPPALYCTGGRQGYAFFAAAARSSDILSPGGAAFNSQGR